MPLVSNVKAIDQTEPEACWSYNKDPEREIARPLERERSIPARRCNLSSLSTNHEVQTYRATPHQPPVLQIKLSSCHWSVTRAEEWKQTSKCAPQLSDRIRLTPHDCNTNNKARFRGWRSRMLHGCLVLRQAFESAMGKRHFQDSLMELLDFPDIIFGWIDKTATASQPLGKKSGVTLNLSDRLMIYFGKNGELFPCSGVFSVSSIFPFMGIVFFIFEVGCKNERTQNSFSNAAFLKSCHTVVSEISNLTALTTVYEVNPRPLRSYCWNINWPPRLPPPPPTNPLPVPLSWESCHVARFQSASGRQGQGCVGTPSLMKK